MAEKYSVRSTLEQLASLNMVFFNPRDVFSANCFWQLFDLGQNFCLPLKYIESMKSSSLIEASIIENIEI